MADEYIDLDSIVSGDLLPEDAAEVDFHRGEVLMHLANTYDTLVWTVNETIQNGVDADATVIMVAIDLQHSRVVVADNGSGIGAAKFHRALASVGKGIKSADKIGQFGLGLISPLNKCRAFTITSRPKDDSSDGNTVNQWLFVGEEIRSQHRRVTIPHNFVGNLSEIPTPFKTKARRLGVKWSTIVEMADITKDRTIRAIGLDDLELQIRSKLSDGMRRAGTTVHIFLNSEAGEMTSRVVSPQKFTGTPLPIVEYVDVDCGAVRFELYRAPKTRAVRRGQVLIKKTGDNTSIPWREFRAQAMGSNYLREFPEAFQVLGSGYFEGTIHVQKLSLDPRRSKFALGDPLTASYMVIARWYEEHGKQLFTAEQEMRREERYQKLGEESLEHLLRKLAEDPLLSLFLEELQGSTPTPEPKATNKAKDDEPKVRRTVAEPRERRKPSPPSPRDRPDRQTQPSPASLRFAYEQRPTWEKLWDYEVESVTIVFNTLHPEWVRLAETPDGKHTPKQDKQVIHLQTWLGLEVVMALSESSNHDDFERRIRPYARLLIETTR